MHGAGGKAAGRERRQRGRRRRRWGPATTGRLASIPNTPSMPVSRYLRTWGAPAAAAGAGRRAGGACGGPARSAGRRRHCLRRQPHEGGGAEGHCCRLGTAPCSAGPVRAAWRPQTIQRASKMHVHGRWKWGGCCPLHERAASAEPGKRVAPEGHPRFPIPPRARSRRGGTHRASRRLKTAQSRARRGPSSPPVRQPAGQRGAISLAARPASPRRLTEQRARLGGLGGQGGCPIAPWTRRRAASSRQGRAGPRRRAAHLCTAEHGQR